MFNEFLDALENNPFEETPVDAKTFVEGEDYLNQPPLSDVQYDIVEAMSQVYRIEDLKILMGSVEGEKHYKKYTKNEIILQLGKGSGKDFTSTVACAYIVYKLLCLKDPARYYGKPSGDAIDIINVAINAQQAKNVFFKGFKTKIEKSKWFAGKYDSKVDSITFDKTITVYSGHSERESHEGLNLILAVLDEISGFASEVTNGNEQGKTADNIYKAFRGSVDSRFPDLGKVALLSFPRYVGDFISKRYEDVIADKETIEKTHTFIINPELNHDDLENQFSISWDEDHIKSYKYPGIFALKRPTWIVNPTRKIDDFKIAFITDLGDAMMRFACVPTYASDAFFKQIDKVERAMSLRNPVDSFRRFDPSFKPDPDKVYFVHADLAQKHDKCAVAIAHVEKWVNIEVIKDYEQVAPIVVVDAVAWWEPRAEGPVNLSEVKQWIINLRREGFNLGMVSFDRWQSYDIQQELKAVGIRTDTVSVAKKHYEDLAMMIYEERVAIPHIPLLLDEMSELKITNNGKKVDHPRKKSKDLADAVTGAVFGAISHTEKDVNYEIEVHTWGTADKLERLKREAQTTKKQDMSEEVRDFLDDLGLL
jgi:hypothetical protein